jgi:chaperonin GroES
MANVDIKPLGDQVLVKRAEPAEVSDGGILLPETATDKPQEGLVIAIGSGRVLDDGSRSTFQVSVGDRVIFTSYAGNEISHKGEEYLLMKESDVLAIMP